MPMNIEYCILRLRAGNSVKAYESVNTSLLRGEQLRSACNEADAGDVLLLAAETFDVNGSIDGAFIFPSEVTLKGVSTEKTKLFSSLITDTHGTAFQLTNTMIEDLTIECESSNEKEDAKAIGFPIGYDSKSSNNIRNNKEIFSSTISRCHIISNAWGVYNANNGNSDSGDYLNIKDSKITSGRQGISTMGSGAYSQNNTILVERCIFNIDGRGQYPLGAVSNTDGDCYNGDCYPAFGGVYGIITRGAKVTVNECVFNLIGNSKLPKCIGISDAFNYAGRKSQQMVIKSSNNKFYITRNSVPESYAHQKLKKQSIFISKNDYVEGAPMNNTSPMYVN